MVYGGLLLIEIGTIRVVVAGDGVCTLLLLCLCCVVFVLWLCYVCVVVFCSDFKKK